MLFSLVAKLYARNEMVFYLHLANNELIKLQTPFSAILIYFHEELAIAELYKVSFANTVFLKDLESTSVHRKCVHAVILTISSIIRVRG